MAGFRNILLTPDPDSGGGAATAQPTMESSQPRAEGSAPAGGAPQAPPAANGGGIDHERYQRALQAQQESSRLWQELSKHGIKSQDDLRRAVEFHAKVQADQKVRGVVDAMTAPPAAPDPETLPVTPRTIEQVVGKVFEQREALAAQRAAKEAQAQAAQAEIRNIDETFGSDQFRSFVNGASFEDAQDGKAGPVAQAFALLVDRHVVAATTRPDGTRVFATDRKIVENAMAKAAKDLSAIRAASVVGASRNGQSAAPPPYNPTAVEPQQADPYASRSQQAADRARAITETFRAAFAAAGGGTG